MMRPTQMNMSWFVAAKRSQARLPPSRRVERLHRTSDVVVYARETWGLDETQRWKVGRVDRI